MGAFSIVNAQEYADAYSVKTECTFHHSLDVKHLG